jgi:hypothetical protein
MQPNDGHEEVEQVRIVPGVRDDLMPHPQGLLAAHHGLVNPVLFLVQERHVEERHSQLQKGRVALLPAALPLLVALGVDQQQPRPAGLQHPHAHVVHPIVPPLLQLEQAEVLRAVRGRLCTPWR